MKSLGNFPDPFRAEIAGQPGALRRAAQAVGDQIGVLERIAEASEHRTVVLTGMGASYDACYPIASELARLGRIAPMVDAAELLHFRSAMLGVDTLLVAVSQSGNSAEVVRLADALRRRAEPPPILAITNGLDNKLASLATHTLDTRAGDEAGPSSMTFAATLVVLEGVVSALTGVRSDITVELLEERAEETAVAIERLLATVSLDDELLAWLGDRRSIVLLGRGPARAAAELGALTLKEAVGAQAESLQTGQFRHGPLELAGPALAVVIVATEPETLPLDLGLADELLDTGAAVLLVTQADEPPRGARGFRIGQLDRLIAPAASVVPIQLLAHRLALGQGRTPGGYLRASKVTTRE